MFRRGHDRLKVGILTTDDRQRGLWRDAESLSWALADRSLPGPRRDVTLFAVGERDSVDLDPHAARASRCPGRSWRRASAGTRFADWLDGLHTLISVEYMTPRAFELAMSRNVRVVFVPNLDWAILHPGSEDTAAWSDAVRDSGVRVWARTPSVGRRLRQLGIEAIDVPWSIPDPVVRVRSAAARRGPCRFLVNAGNGGFRNRRGVDIALRAFQAARRSDPSLTLTIKTIRPLDQYLPPDVLPAGDGVSVLCGFYHRARMAALYATHDTMLHPSRWEGFGIALLEALHAGIPVLATDGWPMNDLVVDGSSGLLVRATQTGLFRLTPWWECDADALAAAMLRIAHDGELRRRMESGERDRLEEMQRSFVEAVRRLVDDSGD